MPTRKAFGEGVAALMRRRGDVVALDGEVGNSTHLEEVLKATPERYFEVYIAEQMLLAEAIGFQVRHWTPFAATFAAFLSRAYDFVRMGVISQAKLCLNGSHAGVSIGEDGPSQMALEDLAEMRALGGSVVLYPSDPNQTVKLVQQMADHDGISYLRSTRSGLPTIYGPDEQFPIGGAKVVRESDDDQVTLIGAGVTLHEAVKAADTLAEDGINARVIDLYSVKPVDADTLTAASNATGGRLVVAEDHWPEGGLGDAVLNVFADADERPRVVKLAVDAAAGLRQGRRADARGRDRRRRHRRRRPPAGRARPPDRHGGRRRRPLTEALLVEAANRPMFRSLASAPLGPVRRPGPRGIMYARHGPSRDPRQLLAPAAAHLPRGADRARHAGPGLRRPGQRCRRAAAADRPAAGAHR